MEGRVVTFPFTMTDPVVMLVIVVTFIYDVSWDVAIAVKNWS